MSKITLTDLANLQNETTAVNAINNNSAAIVNAIEKTLSRDGTSPNTMGATLDMNSNKIINLTDAISVDEPVTLGQMVDALVENGSLNIGATTVPVSAAMQPVVNSSTIADAQGLLGIPAAFPNPYVDCTDPIFAGGVKANGVTDDTAALQAAVDFAAGREVRMPPGTLVISSQIRYETNVLFDPGLWLTGSGTEITFIDNRVANAACIYTGGAASAFQNFGKIANFGIITTTNPVSSHGVEHYAAYKYTVENLHIKGLSGDAFRVTSNLGDATASNTMLYNNCYIESCLYGINCDFAPTVLQPSYMRVENCIFNNCTTGWKWVGLSGSQNNCIYTECQIGLLIYNNGGSNAQFTSIQCGFENNAKAMEIQALQGGTFIETELAGSNIFVPSTKAVDLIACVGARFSETRVRINSTPHVLWTFAAGATGNEITNTFYQNYDLGGQTRYVVSPSAYGNRFDDSFDSIVLGTYNGITAITCVNGLNSDVALPVDGAAYGIVGPSSAFSIGGFLNGYLGRRLTLVNGTGQDLTLVFESASSSTVNRLSMNAGTNVTVNNAGSATFLYFGDSRWHLVGTG